VQSSVLGKEQPEEAVEEAAQGVLSNDLNGWLRDAFLIRHGASGSGAGAAGPILSFSGDMEDDGEDQPIDLFGQASAEQDGEDDSGGEGEGEEDDGEPEDDFNAAWEVLDLARAIYEKQKEDGGDEEVNLKLADTFIALGDVSLETGVTYPSLKDIPLTCEYRKV
jgi:HAT1-interacting factor 1